MQNSEKLLKWAEAQHKYFLRQASWSEASRAIAIYIECVLLPKIKAGVLHTSSNKRKPKQVSKNGEMVSRSTSRPSDPISVAKIKINYDKERLSQWESRWGSLHENWSLVHFLLTYHYVNSWERECYENYLPLSLEDFLNIIPEGWEPFYIDHYTLPYLRQCVQNDFGIDLQDRTHLKLILKRVPSTNISKEPRNAH